jgi:DNA-binding MarR family transcriptional regulator
MATESSPSGEIAEFAGQLLFRVWRASHTRTAEAFESIGLTPALFALLNVLGAREGAMQQEIGADMGIDRSTRVVLIDELEAKRFAKRRPHPADRRAREVAITAKGRQVLERARDIALQVEGEVLRGLTIDERDELVALLRRALSTAPPQSPWRVEEGD